MGRGRKLYVIFENRNGELGPTNFEKE